MSFIPESILFPNHEDHHNLFPTSSPHDFLPVPDFMMRRSVSFSGMDRPEEFHPDDDGSDDGSQYQLGEKKRRLNLDQVKALEKSFDSANKLEPERKVQLARTLGLQPRQIAIWFQNRRARWKTKQLEKDYDVLKAKFEELKADNDVLKSQNNNLQTQLSNLKSKTGINLNKDNEGSNWSNGSETSCDLNAINSTICYPPKNIGSSSQTPAANDHCFGSVMFGGIEENPEFWPWPEQQNFH